MASIMSQVIESAAGALAANGKIEHIWVSCTKGGSVNAAPDKDGITCTACEINLLAKGLIDSREASR